MGLPFLKNKEGSASSPAESIERKPDDEPSYDTVDAVAEDILAAVASKDVSRLKAALQSLIEHIQDLDSAQDQTNMGAS